ncbi:unnamed protein product, partial [Discosporangium mesarthrocarpum]
MPEVRAVTLNEGERVGQTRRATKNLAALMGVDTSRSKQFQTSLGHQRQQQRRQQDRRGQRQQQQQQQQQKDHHHQAAGQLPQQPFPATKVDQSSLAPVSAAIPPALPLTATTTTHSAGSSVLMPWVPLGKGRAALGTAASLAASATSERRGDLADKAAAAAAPSFYPAAQSATLRALVEVTGGERGMAGSLSGD